MGFKRTVQSLLRYPEENCQGKSKTVMEIIAGDEGLRCFAGEFTRPPMNVLPAAAVRPEMTAPPQQSAEITLYDGDAASLELCTENLGCESCREGKMDEEEEKKLRERSGRSTIRKKETRKREIPPPLTWLSDGENGRGLVSSHLKAVKKDGRLILTEVRIERREFLRATRDGGRLRMTLVKRAAEEEEKIPRRREMEVPSGMRCHVAAAPPFMTAARFVTTA